MTDLSEFEAIEPKRCVVMVKLSLLNEEDREKFSAAIDRRISSSKISHNLRIRGVRLDARRIRDHWTGVCICE